MTQPESKKRSFIWSSLPFFIIAHAAHHLMTALPQPLLPYIQEEFNLNYMRSAIVTSSFALSAGGAQLPSGWLADRIGPTLLITAGILGVAAGGGINAIVGKAQNIAAGGELEHLGNVPFRGRGVFNGRGLGLLGRHP